MMDWDIVPAESVGWAERAALLNAAYADYFVPLQVTPEHAQAMQEIYSVDGARSVMARVGSELVGIAQLACRGERGWVSAVGVTPAWRRRGVARCLMQALLDHARTAGLCEVRLEVIDRNAPARALYTSLGFRITRELLTWRFPAVHDALPVPPERLVPAPGEVLLDRFAAWHEQPPCWQREEATLRKLVGRTRGYGLALDDVPAGYCLVSEQGDAISILDVGLNPQFGPVQAGRVLLQALAALYPGRSLTITNVPVDDGLNRALAALHFLVTVRQHEMIVVLR